MAFSGLKAAHSVSLFGSTNLYFRLADHKGARIAGQAFVAAGNNGISSCGFGWVSILGDPSPPQWWLSFWFSLKPTWNRVPSRKTPRLDTCGLFSAGLCGNGEDVSIARVASRAGGEQDHPVRLRSDCDNSAMPSCGVARPSLACVSSRGGFEKTS